MKVACLVVALSLALAISLPHAAEDSRDLTGIYEGELNFASHTLRITATLVQTGDHVAGLWSTSSGSGSGTMTGTVSAGAILDWEGVQTAPCPGALRGSASIKDRGAILEGPYMITNCQGTTEASFHVERHLIVRNDDLKPTYILGLAIRQE